MPACQSVSAFQPLMSTFGENSPGAVEVQRRERASAAAHRAESRTRRAWPSSARRSGTRRRRSPRCRRCEPPRSRRESAMCPIGASLSDGLAKLSKRYGFGVACGVGRRTPRTDIRVAGAARVERCAARTREPIHHRAAVRPFQIRDLLLDGFRGRVGVARTRRFVARPLHHVVERVVRELLEVREDDAEPVGRRRQSGLRRAEGDGDRQREQERHAYFHARDVRKASCAPVVRLRPYGA